MSVLRFCWWCLRRGLNPVATYREIKRLDRAAAFRQHLEARYPLGRR